MAKCNKFFLDPLEGDDERADIIAEYIDDLYSDNAHPFMLPKTVWQLINLVFSDADYATAKRRILRHLARKQGMSRDMFGLLEENMSVIANMEKEKAALESSNRPYKEVSTELEALEDKFDKAQRSVNAIISKGRA